MQIESSSPDLARAENEEKEKNEEIRTRKGEFQEVSFLGEGNGNSF